MIEKIEGALRRIVDTPSFFIFQKYPYKNVAKKFPNVFKTGCKR